MTFATNKTFYSYSCNQLAFKDGHIYGPCLAYQQQTHTTLSTSQQAQRIWSKHH